MILFTMNGYIQPYKTRGSNYLNAVILISFMVLLMLQANSYLKDSLNVIHNGTMLTSIPSCYSNDVIATPFSILLAIVYYLPLLIVITYLVVKIVQCLFEK